MNLYKEIETWIKKQAVPFISERHLQDELWYYMRNTLGIKDVVVEFPFKQGHTKGHSFLDIYAVVDNIKYGIEIKYQTKHEIVSWYGEDIHLKNKGADDEFRMACVQDIQRLEWLIKHKETDKGIFILLSNSETVWAETKRETMDKEFRFYNKDKQLRTLTGKLNIKNVRWTEKYQNIELEGKYKFEKKQENNTLLYTMLEVHKKNL